MIRQKVMKRYSNPIEYYEEVVSNLGLVVIFSAIFPALPLLALVLNVFIVKVDEWFLCNEYQRPYPHPTSSVRIWTSITKAQVFIAIVVNLWWIVEKLGGLMKVNKFYVMVVAGLVVVVVVYKMYVEMQKIPEDVQKSIRWGERVVKERIKGKSLNYEVQNELREKYLGNQLGTGVQLEDNRKTFLGESEASLTSIP